MIPEVAASETGRAQTITCYGVEDVSKETITVTEHSWKASPKRVIDS